MSANLPLAGIVSRADAKWLHDVSFVAVVDGIVEPPVWDEGTRFKKALYEVTGFIALRIEIVSISLAKILIFLLSNILL